MPVSRDPVEEEGGGGVTDHGLLTGLADDDHPQYALVGEGGSLEAPFDLTLLSNGDGTQTSDGGSAPTNFTANPSLRHGMVEAATNCVASIEATGEAAFAGGKALSTSEPVATSYTLDANGASSGSFAASDGYYSSASFDYDASASEVQAAVEYVLGATTVVVTGVDGGPWTIDFEDDLADRHIYLEVLQGSADVAPVLTKTLGTTSARIAAIDNSCVASGYSHPGIILAEGHGSSARGVAANGEIVAHGYGSFAQGYTYIGGKIVAQGYGSFAHGYSSDNSLIAAYNNGTAFGFCDVAGKLIASEQGASAQGYAYGSSLIHAEGKAATARGYANNFGTILASGDGSFAQGYCFGAGSIIEATSAGAFAQGYVIAGGSIISEGYGSIASGYAQGDIIQASGYGSLAFGWTNGSDVIASANNSVQFGPGTNAEANSLKVGVGIHLIGTAAAPGTPVDGMIWVDGGGDVYIRSGGVSVLIA